MSQNTELKAQTKKPGLNKKGIAAWINNYSFILIALAIFIAYLFINHGATTWSGVMNILRHSAVVGIMAFGMGLVIITGGIINGRSGRCGEDCKYCAQSACHHTGCEEYGFLAKEEILANAKANQDAGANRFAIVTSGRALTGADFEKALDTYRTMKQTLHIDLCASHGLLTPEQLHRLHETGVTSYHHNIETSRRFFPYICTTHTYDDRIRTIKAAQKEGLCVCSGGIIGTIENALVAQPVVFVEIVSSVGFARGQSVLGVVVEALQTPVYCVAPGYGIEIFASDGVLGLDPCRDGCGRVVFQRSVRVGDLYVEICVRGVIVWRHGISLGRVLCKSH